MVALKGHLAGSAEDGACLASTSVIEGPGIDGGTAAVVLDEAPDNLSKLVCAGGREDE